MTRLLTCALAVIGLGVVLTRPPARRALSALGASLSAGPAGAGSAAQPQGIAGPVSEGSRNQPGGPSLPQPVDTQVAEERPAPEGNAESAAAPGDQASPADDIQDAPNAASPLLKALEVYERADAAEKPGSGAP